MEKIINIIATGFGIAYIPLILFKREGKFKGCGFFGTLFALLTYKYFIPHDYKVRLIMVVIYIVLALFISEKAFKNDNEKDNPLIVIDEIVGYFCGFIFIEKNLKDAIILFIFFRLFDTIKPFPIKEIEKINSKGLSIVLDDFIAGLYAGIFTYLILYLL